MQATRLEHALSPAAEWILDNTYLIQTQINEVERHLPRDYSAWANAGNGHGDITAVAHGSGFQSRLRRDRGEHPGVSEGVLRRIRRSRSRSCGPFRCFCGSR